MPRPWPPTCEIKVQSISGVIRIRNYSSPWVKCARPLPDLIQSHRHQTCLHLILVRHNLKLVSFIQLISRISLQTHLLVHRCPVVSTHRQGLLLLRQMMKMKCSDMHHKETNPSWYFNFILHHHKT